MPCLSHGKVKLKPGPRKKHPMMTSTAHIIRNIVIIVMANFRSSGLCDGFLSMNGTIARSERDAGQQHAGDHRVEHLQQLLQTRGSTTAPSTGSASRSRRRGRAAAPSPSAEKTVTNAISERIDANSSMSRCGHTCTLSCASARVCWIEPDLTTVSRRWVWPPGPVPVGAGAATAVAVRAAPAAAGAASPPPPGERGLALARPLEQVRGDAALVSR